ncbi:MAG: bifunctional serine/threonine-protein kinase/formylglycine-generating enzyme family protein [Acidobacteria bacterium]|jgi:serine/threonine-protein kinase|nr:bifunctional serine/threonine-protein kinase/formylglycine-generating enzyme family protein [Acidobacteriota bacterium]
MTKIGKYTISGELGKGGMGIVYRGLDPYIGRTVAIKTIRLDMLRQDGGKEEVLKRFVREAQAAGNLSHPNIVTIYDVGEHEELIYIAMEFIAGHSLESLMLQGRKFTLAEIVRLFAQLASALDYAHQKGIVHRDIKPANILVGEDLKVSLVDFGIARTSASTMTQTGMLMGTPRYMSPEQIAGKKVDNRADIFSLGAILYELLTQRNPFEGESITTVIYKIMHAEIEPLEHFNKQLPPGLEGVVRKALARDADARYRTCGELHAALSDSIMPKKCEATIIASAPRAQETQMIPAADVPAAPAGAKSRVPLFLLLGAVIGILAVIIVVVVLSGRKEGAPTAPGGGSAALPLEAPLDPGPPAAGAGIGQEGRSASTESVAPGPVAAEAPEGRGAVEPVSGKPLRVQPQPTEVAKKSDTAPAAEAALPALVRPNRQGYLEEELFNSTVMVQVPAGNFTIGSPKGEGDDDEHPAHMVFISGFWLGKTEVTFAQYDAFCQETGRRFPGDEGWGRGSRPVINITWEDAGAYCRWLAKKSGRSFRLPTEAEWEKAARERYPWGKRDPGPSLVNMKGDGDGYPFTAPVGSFPAGASHYGHLDLAGNVWEWTSDWYAAGYYRASPFRDPCGPDSGTKRSVRGGSWKGDPGTIRSANRDNQSPGIPLNTLGFRVAMDDR